MITYTYKCSKCGRTYDIRQHYVDPAKTHCPMPDVKDPKKLCLGEIKRVINATPVIFNTKMS